jgi:hypothetical protein
MLKLHLESKNKLSTSELKAVKVLMNRVCELMNGL